MRYWKLLVIALAVVASVFLRAATFAQRNLPSIHAPETSALVVATASHATSSEDYLLNLKTHGTSRRHALLSKVFVSGEPVLARAQLTDLRVPPESAEAPPPASILTPSRPPSC